MEQPKEYNDKIHYQPDLFLDRTAISTLYSEYYSLSTKLGNLRRGLFERLSKLTKSLESLILRFDDRDIEIAELRNRIQQMEIRFNERFDCTDGERF